MRRVTIGWAELLLVVASEAGKFYREEHSQVEVGQRWCGREWSKGAAVTDWDISHPTEENLPPICIFVLHTIYWLYIVITIGQIFFSSVAVSTDF